MQINIKRWPHNWVFFGVCTVYLAMVTEPTLLYACFGSVLPDVPAFSTRPGFLTDAIKQPGGLVFAMTGLLSQCFYFSWPGALVIMVTGLGLSELTRRHFKAAGLGNLSVLTCLPVIMIILIYSRYQHPLLGVLAVCLGLLSAWIVARMPCRNPKLGALLLCVMTVVTFWLGATGALVVFLAMTLIHTVNGQKHRIALALGLPMALAIIWILLEYVAVSSVAQAWPLTLPLSKAVTGEMKSISKGLMFAIYSYVPVCLGALLLGRWAWHRGHRSHANKHRKNKTDHATDPKKRRDPVLIKTLAVLAVPLVGMGVSLYITHDPFSKPYIQTHYHSQLRQWPELLKTVKQLPKG
ncbi:MAG: hypothetical protein HQ515_11040, partial [Phycisphaeraceae bacterium]|nr:hypothetical protein [Phycisphaeraceae bacterium]